MRESRLFRWPWLIAVPLAGIIWLTIRIDTASLIGKRAWWVTPLGYSGKVLSALLAAIAAGVLVAVALRRRSEPGAGAALPSTGPGSPIAELGNCRPQPRGRWWAFLLAHAGALIAFCGLTIYLMEGGAADSPLASVWLAAWLGMGLIAASLWLAAALPPSRWWPVLRTGWPVAVSGLAVGVAAWAASLATGGLWEPLRESTFRSVQWLLRAVGQEVVCEPSSYLLGTPQFRVAIAPECSGYEGIGLIWIFLIAYLWLFRRKLRWPWALLLLPLGTVLMWLANVLRLTGLILFGAKVSRQIALGGFHSQVGWMGFVGVSLGMVVLTQRLTLFSVHPAVEAPADNRAGQRSVNHTARYLGPLLAWSAMIMVTKALTSGFDWLYPAQVLAMAAAIWLLWGRAIAAKGWPDYLAPGAVGIGVLVFCLWTVLTLVSRPVGGEERSIATALAAMPVAWAAVWSACRVVGFIVTVPITEELAFRGYLLRQLIGARFEAIDPRRFTWISFVISSVLFGALHGQRWVPGILAGMCYAWAVYRRGKLSDAVVAHATTNGLLAIVALVSGDWALWM